MGTDRELFTTDCDSSVHTDSGWDDIHLFNTGGECTSYFDNALATGGNNIVEVFESFLTMDIPLFSGHLGLDALSHLMLSLQ